ncbi:cucumber peeling cupredoxin-like [Salvia divinorum]|uniref:Cucumber peeling cupredoxin-like n=1 Tax=Salvia divinorum TaxID=28513 RepID=A0ABD1ICK8_SALDI
MDRVSFIMIYSAFIGLVVNIAAAQNIHIVGDNMGWGIPTSTSVSYSNWASGKTFMVGDILVFNFMTNEHDVVQVPKASYDDCTEDNAIGNVITTGPANITLDTAGERYYICSIGGHCGAGQKLSIIVVSSSTGGPTPPMTTPSPATPTTPSPATPTTPSPTTPTTPSPATPQPDACAPTPDAESPRAGGPTPRTGFIPPPPPPPPNSASVSLTSSFLLGIASVALVFIF